MSNEPRADTSKSPKTSPVSSRVGTPFVSTDARSNKGGCESCERITRELRRLQSEVDKLKFAEHKRREDARKCYEAEEAKEQARQEFAECWKER